MTMAVKKTAIERLQCVPEGSGARRRRKQRTDRQQRIDKKRVLMYHLVVLLDVILESLQTIIAEARIRRLSF